MIKRIPVSQEFIADSLASQMKGESISHPALEYFSNALYDDMNKLVHKYAHKYKNSIVESEEELAQNCFLHLFKRIGKFDSTRGRFTTFASWVCINHLKGLYEKAKKGREHFVRGYDESENQEGSSEMCEYNKHIHVSDSILRQEIADTVQELIVKYPDKAELTIGILGQPTEIAQRRFNDEVKLSRLKNYTKKEKEYFFSHSIVPYFKSRFGGLYV